MSNLKEVWRIGTVERLDAKGIAYVDTVGVIDFRDFYGRAINKFLDSVGGEIKAYQTIRTKPAKYR